MSDKLGTWIGGPNVGMRGVAVGVDAGRLVVVSSGGTVFGLPADFRADTGEAADALMATILPPPRKDLLFHGAVRETLASAHATALSGACETRAWDSLDSYVIDDEEGGLGVVQFAMGLVVGALRTHEVWRPFDVDGTLQAAPEAVRGGLETICKLPLLRPDGVMGVTAVFWSGDAVLESVEPWHSVHVHGAVLLARELTNDQEWVPDAARHYDLDESVAASICHIALRRTLLEPLALRPEELELLMPGGAPRRSDGLERLLSGGAVVVL